MLVNIDKLYLLHGWRLQTSKQVNCRNFATYKKAIAIYVTGTTRLKKKIL